MNYLRNRTLIAGIVGLLAFGSAMAFELVIINPQKTPKYSNSELQNRVWALENAVLQLQRRVFDLEVEGATAAAKPKKSFTCYIQSFGKTFTATKDSESAAKADVLSKCSSATNAMHCDVSDVTCGE
jgi:hypothetical protein